MPILVNTATTPSPVRLRAKVRRLLVNTFRTRFCYILRPSLKVLLDASNDPRTCPDVSTGLLRLEGVFYHSREHAIEVQQTDTDGGEVGYQSQLINEQVATKMC